MRIIKVSFGILAFAFLLLCPLALYAQGSADATTGNANLMDARLIRYLVGTGIYFAFGFLHLLLYTFYPRNRANIFFSIVAFSMSALQIGIFLRGTNFLDSEWKDFLGFLNIYSIALVDVFLLLFLYKTFSPRIPKYFWAYLILKILASVPSISLQTTEIVSWLNALLFFFVAVEAVRVMAVAVFQRKDGAILVFCGVFLHSTAPFGAAMERIGLELPSVLQSFGAFYTLGLVFSASIYLARQFAQTNKNLETQLVREVEHEKDKARLLIVEAENERRAKELEEARQLQLSMLPKKLPQIAGLEIAAYMKPATEVGGDYYDFHVGEDGILTVAVGDATGHGLKAGTVVTATKGLFNNLAAAPDIPHTLRQISSSLKAMNLRGLFMAMTLLKIKDNQVNLSIAGMPSALIYRAESRTVEEISIRAMPLGSLTKFNYQNRRLALFSGDVIVLMSDGFPEMFNQQNEILGFEKATEILPQIAMNSPQEIINRLVQTSEDWANGRPQDDDVTFVVLKVTNGRGH